MYKLYLEFADGDAFFQDQLFSCEADATHDAAQIYAMNDGGDDDLINHIIYKL